MLNDFRQAVRLLRGSPGFTAAVILILMLGLGANAAVFAILDATLFTPVPYRDADRLVEIETIRLDSPTWSYPGRAGVSGWERVSDVRSLSEVFEGIEPYYRGIGAASVGVIGQEPPEPLCAGKLTHRMFSLLGIQAALGRGFTSDDIRAGDTIVIGHDLWHRKFGANPDAIGKNIRIDDRAYTVIGVAPSSLRYAVGFPACTGTDRSLAEQDVWLPLDETSGLPGSAYPRSDTVIARLRSGITLSQAQQRLDWAIRRLQVQKPQTWPPSWKLKLHPLGWFFRVPVPRNALLALSGGVLLVLLVAYANVVSLLLSRTLLREHEVAVRAALGATRWQLARQFAIEGFVLAGASGVAAIVLARWVVDALPLLVPFASRWLFAIRSPRVDIRVLGFVVAATAVTAAVCGVGPTLRSSKILARGLRLGQQLVGRPRERRTITRAFESVQVAMTVVLLAGFGVLLASFVRMVRTDEGFDSRNLAFALITAPEDPVPQNAFLDDVVRRVKTLPGVQAATLGPPPARSFFAGYVAAERPTGKGATVHLSEVPPDYFAVAGIPLLEGRGLGLDDTGDAVTAVVSRDMARHFWRGQSAIGQRFRYATKWVTVVGVAGNVKSTTFDRDDASLQAWLGVARGGLKPADLLIRTQGDSKSVLPAVRALVNEIDSRQKVINSGAVADLYKDTLLPYRLYAGLAGALAAIGLLTAMAGLYALLSFSIGQRTREMGLRMALGASRSQIGVLVMAEAMEPVGLGLVVGLIGWVTLAPLVRDFVYQGTPYDVRALMAVVVAMLIAALWAAVGPLRRAAGVDPAAALRSE
jgi:predicted permease